jgi:hypothetical protein
MINDDYPDYEKDESNEDECPNRIDKLESATSKNAKELEKLNDEMIGRLSKENKPKLKVEREKKVTILSIKQIADRYRKAWNICHKNLPNWKKTVFEASIRDKTFGNHRWDDEFAKQVISLAESDDPLN